MRIEGEPGQPLRGVYLWLTKSEAQELKDALNDLLANGGPEWHAHIPSGDFSLEVTLAVDST